MGFPVSWLACDEVRGGDLSNTDSRLTWNGTSPSLASRRVSQEDMNINFPNIN